MRVCVSNTLKEVEKMPAKIEFKKVLELMIKHMEWQNVELQEKINFAQFQSVLVSYNITDRLRKQKELWHMIGSLGLANDISPDRPGALEVYLVNVGAVKAFLLGSAIHVN